MPNIRYSRLWFKNGYTYRHCEMPLDQQGLVLLRGLNMDDGCFLGAGKTSPFEIFAQLQVGKGGKDRKGDRALADDPVNLMVGSDFEAHLELTVDDRDYELVRYRNHHTHKSHFHANRLPAGYNDLPNEHRSRPEKWLSSELLHIDERTMFSYVYLPQDYNNMMLAGTDSDRQKAMIQAFGLGIYDKLRERAVAKLSLLNVGLSDLEKLEKELVNINTELEACEFDLPALEEELHTKEAELSSFSSRHKKAIDKRDVLVERLSAVKQRRRFVREAKAIWESSALSSVFSGIADVSSDKCDELEQKAVALEKKVASIGSSLDSVKARDIVEKRLNSLPVARAVSIIQEDLDTVKDQLRQLQNIDLPNAEKRIELIQELRNTSVPEDPDLDEIKNKWRTNLEKKVKLESAIDEISSHLSDQVCPTCKRPFDLTVEEIAELKQDLSARRASLQKLVKVISVDEAAIANIEQYQQIKQKLSDLPNTDKPKEIQVKINSLRKREKRLHEESESGTLKAQLQSKLDAMPVGSLQELKDKHASLAKKAKHYRDLFKDASSVLDRKERIKDLPKGQVEDLEERTATLLEEVTSLADVITELGEVVAGLKSERNHIKELRKRKQKLESGVRKAKNIHVEVRCLTALKKAFGSTGLKRDRFQQILQDASDHTVPYYTEMLWPRQTANLKLIEHGSSLRFALDRTDGPQVTSRLLSGGERNKAGLALLFGIRDLKERYTGLRTNFLVVDEPFSNLDPVTVSCLIKVLRDVSERIGTVIVIGNQRDVLEHEDMFDQVWWAVREQHESRLYLDGVPSKYSSIAEKLMERSS